MKITKTTEKQLLKEEALKLFHKKITQKNVPVDTHTYQHFYQILDFIIDNYRNLPTNNEAQITGKLIYTFIDRLEEKSISA
ncbi:MAG: hypothetical protein ACOCQ1_04660 [Halanaerobiaceae bacterium]